MKTPESLNSFMSIVENNHPEILPLIIQKNEYFVEFELPCNPSKTFAEQTDVLNPILHPNVSMPIKQTSVSFHEKHECFKIFVNLK
jgi:hypothetical protein